MTRLFRWFILGAVSLLSACAAMPTKQTSPVNIAPTAAALEQEWLLRRADLSAVTNWKFRGRSSILQGTESWQAGLRWQQQSGDYALEILGPFSMGGLKIEGDGNTVILTLNDGQKIEETEVEKLIMSVTGLMLPVTALRDWVRGLPAENLPLTEKILNNNAEITEMQQGEWKVEFPEYISVADITLPRKVFVGNANLRLRLVIDRWKLK